MPTTVFAGPQTIVSTSEGEVDLPILYFDTTTFNAFFLVDHARAQPLLKGTGLEAPRLPGGKTLAALAFFEYRKTSIGSYNEVGLCVAAHPAGKPQPNMVLDFTKPSAKRTAGFHILDLPVTTAIANAAGRELWGFPKFVTEIPLQFGEKRFSGGVLDPIDGQPIFTFAGSWRFDVKVPGIDLGLYSLRNGTMLHTVIDVDARMRTAGGRNFRLTVGPSKHRMAENLRALGLNGAAPLGIQYTDLFQSRLPAGKPVS